MTDEFERAVDRAADAFLFAVRPTADERAEAAAARELWDAVAVYTGRGDEFQRPVDIDATMAAVAARARDKFMAMRVNAIPAEWRGVHVSEFFRRLDDLVRRIDGRQAGRTNLRGV